MNTTMRCGIFTNAKGEVLIVHDREMKQSIQWIEYHVDNNRIFLIHENGASQDLGFQIDKKAKSHILKSTQVVLAYLKHKKVVSSVTVSLVVLQN